MKKLNLLTLLLSLIVSANLLAQQAQVQIIHNSPDTAVSTVDVWVNNSRVYDDLNFRESTTFISAPSGSPIDVTIQPSNSTDTTNGLFRQTLTLSTNSIYVVVANGIVSSAAYNSAPPFGLDIYANARQSSSGTGITDVLVNHGAPDAPAVDIFEDSVLDATVINNLTYGSFDGYLNLPTSFYRIQVRDSSNSKVLAAYNAPLSTLNAGGLAVTLVASGFVDPSVNSNGAAFGLYAATPAGGPMIALTPVPISSSRMQVIHNAPDTAARFVDVWLNDEMLLDNFEFRTASPFVNVQSNVDAVVSIADSSSTDTSAALAQFDLKLIKDSTYIAVASGIVSSSGYNPIRPFDLDVFIGGRETANQASNTDVLVYHGATDASIVDVYESSVPAGTLVNNLSYGSFNGYLPLQTSDYVIQLRDSANSKVIAAYNAPLSSLNLGGEAITVLASGFLDSTQNSNGSSFGLFAASAVGGQLVPLPQTTIETARMQVIHNSADAAASTVDVWLNDERLLDDLNFRTASPFVDVQAGVDAVISIAGSNSSDTSGSVAQFPLNPQADSTYIAVANGIINNIGYSPNQPFELDILEGARESAVNPANTDVLVYHGSTDAPAVDAVETSVPAGTLIDNLEYSNFSSYLNLATADYAIDLFDSTQTILIDSYSAPLSTLNLGGEAITIVASGFADPTQNSNGPAFGLYVATAAGGALTALPVVTSLDEKTLKSDEIKLHPNPANQRVNLSFNETDIELEGMEILDVNSKVIKSFPLSQPSRTTIDVSDIPKGVYFIRLNTKQQSVLKRLIVQ
ncbi:MAG: DUF4397 domain-containing protein [Vicingaceae bacterium]